ncbi:MAG: beta-ketoacyl-ACP synthase II [Bacteroidetes bacterium]|nr:beta-ketoacyl-ACP synthase II [Bacteroidota bacterium]MBP7477959.1 beta-ketoacyl-ACP synthase II [Chitinophagales bacterium]
MQLKRVVVTGLGAVTPLGNNVGTFWKSILEGQSGANFITHFDTAQFKTKFACEVKNFDPSDFGIDKKETNRLDLVSQYGIAAALEAVNDSNLNDPALDKDRIGVIWSSGIGGLRTFEQEIGAFYTGNGIPRFSPFFIPKMIADITCGHISMRYGFRGPNFAPVAACASSTIALIDAFNYIRLGKSKAILAGGSEAAITVGGMGGFNSMKALSERNEDYLTASRPFDLERDGFVMGEGGIGLVLEEYEHAIARGAKIYAEMVGGGLSADAYHLTAPHPEGLGAMNAMKYALEDAEMQANEIDYINVHGTSTPLGDVAELKAITSLFGDHAYNMNISSTKSMTGHLLGAAGAIEAAACVLAVKEDIIPPTINHKTADPSIDPKLNLTLNVAQKRKVNAALSNTFGFGGHNATVIFKKHNP